MYGFIDAKDNVTLQAKLILPIIIKDMIDGTEPLDDVAELALHEELATMQPDTALLCIALCAQHIAGELADKAIAGTMELEAQRIIRDYGPLWLAHESNEHSLDEIFIEDIIAFIPEDFETIADILETAKISCEDDHSIAYILCDILALHGEAYRDLSNVELVKANITPKSHEDEPQLETAGNVIAFPMGQLSAEIASQKLS